MNFVKQLLKLANELDEQGLHDKASQLDVLAQEMLKRKEPDPQMHTPENLLPDTQLSPQPLPEKSEVELPEQNADDELDAVMEKLREMLGKNKEQ